MRTKAAMMAAMLLMALVASAGNPKQADRVELEGLVTASPVPAGYQVSRKDFSQGASVYANKVFVMQEGTAAKVVITIERRQLTANGDKVAAFKGYVNGTVESLTKTGLKVAKQKVPDLAKADLSQRQTVDLTLAGADGAETYVQIQIFFAGFGYNVITLATSKRDYELLTRWANSVQPK